jgi:dihydroorotate dehydrogenase (NAD+) catalytic subunit
MRTFVGSVPLPNPILTASGTAGHGAELAAYVDLAALGAVVVKSLAAAPWAGNPAPRVHETPAGMLNSVGLQGTGVEAWLADELPALNERGARVVASIWGRRVEDYAQAAAMLAGAPGVVAVEVNVSCPNLDDRSRMFAHSARATAQAVSASAASGLPRWAKLSPNVADIVEIAGAALDAGAEALVLVNTVLGMAIDPNRRAYRLGSGAGGGGLSGPAIRPVAVRAVHDCRAAFPDASIVGVGGVCRGVDAVEMLLAGADAVEVGTATFRDPRAPARVLAGLARWCRLHDVADVRSLVAAVHTVTTPAPAPARITAPAPARTTAPAPAGDGGRPPSTPPPSTPPPSTPAFYPTPTTPAGPPPVRPPSRPVTRPQGPSRLPPPPPRRPGPTPGGDRGR